MADSTLTYSPNGEGWPSFYSYIPDYMIGMNNYFYSFKGGQLYRHNTNETRNNFYGTQYSSTLDGVINDSPLENKLFKTINLEGTSAWDVTLTTDIQSGSIDDTYFEKKEAAWFAFIRSLSADINVLMRSANGIGDIVSFAGTTTIKISFGASVDVGSIISVGDFVFFNDTSTYGGQVVGSAGSTVEIDPSVDFPSTPPISSTAPTVGDFVFYLKNSVAESHGVLGHYCQFQLQNSDTSTVELIAVESEVMKSYP